MRWRLRLSAHGPNSGSPVAGPHAHSNPGCYPDGLTLGTLVASIKVGTVYLLEEQLEVKSWFTPVRADDIAIRCAPT
jgi:hypothetical protein